MPEARIHCLVQRRLDRDIEPSPRMHTGRMCPVLQYLLHRYCVVSDMGNGDRTITTNEVLSESLKEQS
jgi:hypothetical protein